MELTKRQALLVVKLLQAAPEGAVNAYQDDIDELDEAVEAFLTGSDDDQEDTGDVDMGDEEDEEDVEVTDEPEEDDESDDEDDSDEMVSHTGTVSPHALNDLSPVKTTEWVPGAPAKAVEFEMVCRSETVDVITTDGVTELENVRYVCRSADRLELYVDGEWYDYGVTKFPKGWATTLPLGQVLKVGA